MTPLVNRGGLAAASLTRTLKQNLKSFRIVEDKTQTYIYIYIRNECIEQKKKKKKRSATQNYEQMQVQFSTYRAFLDQ